jgi:hypothetical protein
VVDPSSWCGRPMRRVTHKGDDVAHDQSIGDAPVTQRRQDILALPQRMPELPPSGCPRSCPPLSPRSRPRALRARSLVAGAQIPTFAQRRFLTGYGEQILAALPRRREGDRSGGDANRCLYSYEMLGCLAAEGAGCQPETARGAGIAPGPEYRTNPRPAQTLAFFQAPILTIPCPRALRAALLVAGARIPTFAQRRLIPG